MPRTSAAAIASTLVIALAATASGADRKIDIPKLVAMHNAARAKEKLGPLAPNPKLEAAAKVQAKDQADRGKMDHTGGDGSTPAQRIERAGYRYQKCGENVAMGQRSSAEVFEAWMDSPHHKENILGDFDEIGAACYTDADGLPFWCVTFGKSWPKLDPEAAISGMLDALNAARKAEGLPPLKADKLLADAASRHARAVADAGKFLAEDPDGKAPSARAQESGYAALALAQADASGLVDPAKVVKSWTDAEGSKSFVLGDYADVGVGVAADKDGIPFWSVLFGRPRQESPAR